MVASRREAPEQDPILTLGRYALHGEIASGGMATVHFGRMSSLGGFSRTVAIKRMRRDIAMDPEFVAMFLDEARLTSRVEHPNVVATLDVVAEGGEVFLVMEYVRGDSLAHLIRASRHAHEPVPLPIALNVLCGALTGLHAAHEAVGEGGAPLGIIHRDVSPQNILVGEDGITRITDFGIAKAESRLQVTRDGMMKGKLCYMAPEQLARAGRSLDRRVDVFAAGVVAWELLSAKKLFQGDHPGETMANVLNAPIASLTELRNDVSAEVDRAVLKALARDPDNRWNSAEEFATALEDAAPIASNRVVGNWVSKMAGEVLLNRHKYVREMESLGGGSGTPISQIHKTPAGGSHPAGFVRPASTPEHAQESSSRNAPAVASHAPQRPESAVAVAAPAHARVPRASRPEIPSRADPQRSRQPAQSRPAIDAPAVPRPSAAKPVNRAAPAASHAADAHQSARPADSIAAPAASKTAAPISQTASSAGANPIAAAPAPAAAAAPAVLSASVVATAEPAAEPASVAPPHPSAPSGPPAVASVAVVSTPADLAQSKDAVAESMPSPAPVKMQSTDEALTAPPIIASPSPPAIEQSAAIDSVVPSTESAAKPALQSTPGMESLADSWPEVNERKPGLASKLFSTPARTAAVYLGAVGLLGGSVGLFLLAGRSSDEQAPEPAPSAASVPAAASAAPSSVTASPEASEIPASLPQPSASSVASADSAKPAVKKPGAATQAAPAGPRPPAKATRTYLPDRP